MATIIFQGDTTQNTAWNGVLFGGDYAESVNVPGNREEYTQMLGPVIGKAIGHLESGTGQWSKS